MLTVDYYAQHSPMSRWNSGFKILFSVGTLILSIAADSILFSAAVLLLMSFLAVLPGKTPVPVYLRLLLIPALFAFVSCVILLFQLEPRPVGLAAVPFFSRYLCVTEKNLHQAVLLFFKAFGAVSCLYALILTTPSHEVIGTLRRCRIPAILTELMSLIYRFIFVLTDVQRQMLTASLARMGNSSLKASNRTFSGILTNLFVIAMRRSNAVYDAMESRCYDGEFLVLEQKKPLTSGLLAGGILCAVILLLFLALIKTMGWI